MVRLEYFATDFQNGTTLLRTRVGHEDFVITLEQVRALKDFLGALSHDQIADICLNPDNLGYVAEINNPTVMKAIT